MRSVISICEKVTFPYLKNVLISSIKILQQQRRGNSFQWSSIKSIPYSSTAEQIQFYFLYMPWTILLV